MNGVSVPFGGLYVDGRSVMLTNTDGLRLDWNGSTGGRIYVRTPNGEAGWLKIETGK